MKGISFIDFPLFNEIKLTYLFSCQDVLAEMVHTKDGSRVVREFLVRGTAKVNRKMDTVLTAIRLTLIKDRKQILKVLKPHVEKICKDDEAQLVLFTALDVIEYVVLPLHLPCLSNIPYKAIQSSHQNRWLQK